MMDLFLTPVSYTGKQTSMRRYILLFIQSEDPIYNFPARYYEFKKIRHAPGICLLYAVW